MEPTEHEFRAPTEAPVEGARVPTMAVLDALAAELDEVDRTLAELDRRPAPDGS